ncbi:MAG TPA: STAS domain-containing protein [Actinomycetota bacterium]|jgi:anti-anti-sigma factor
MVEYEVAEEQEGRGCLRLRGDLDGDTSERELAGALAGHYTDAGVRVIVVDLFQVHQITLEGVAVLLGLLKESKRRGKRLVIESAGGQVRRKLAVTGLLPILSPG